MKRLAVLVGALAARPPRSRRAFSTTSRRPQTARRRVGRRDRDGRALRRRPAIEISPAAPVLPSSAASCRSTCRTISSCASASAAAARSTRWRSSSPTRAARTSGGIAAPTSSLRANGRRCGSPPPDRIRLGADAGPDLAPRRAIEFVVAAGSGGGRLAGSRVDDLELVPLPSPPCPADRRECRRRRRRRCAWTDRSAILAAGPAARLVLDLGYVREFGGLVLRWSESEPAADYDVDLSRRPGVALARSVRGNGGGADWLRMEESEARCPPPACAVRRKATCPHARPCRAGRGRGAPARLRRERQRLRVRGRAGGPPRRLAARLCRRAGYWTLVATRPAARRPDRRGRGDRVGRGGFSVEPFVVAEGPPLGWADARSVQRLRDGELPIPTVERHGDGWRLDDHRRCRAGWSGGALSAAQHRSGRADPGLELVARPVPGQSAPAIPQHQGRRRPIRSLAWSGGALRVNGVARVRPAVAPTMSGWRPSKHCGQARGPIRSRIPPGWRPAGWSIAGSSSREERRSP